MFPGVFQSWGGRKGRGRRFRLLGQSSFENSVSGGGTWELDVEFLADFFCRLEMIAGVVCP